MAIKTFDEIGERKILSFDEIGDDTKRPKLLPFDQIGGGTQFDTETLAADWMDTSQLVQPQTPSREPGMKGITAREVSPETMQAPGVWKGPPLTKESLGISEVVTGIKEMVAPTTPYTREESERMANEIIPRLDWYLRYLQTAGGKLEPEMIKPEDAESQRDILIQQSKDFAGFGPALMPAATDTAKVAFEWGVLYPALFKGVGHAGEAVAKIPQVQKGAKALAKIGGIDKFAKKFPKAYRYAANQVKAISKGGIVGGTVGGLETLGEGMGSDQIIRHVGKNAATMAVVAGGFQAAGDIDSALWTRSFRRTLLKAHRARYDARISQVDEMPRGPAKSAAIKSIGAAKTRELRAIDDVVAAAKAKLIGMKKGKLYQEGQELIEKPIIAGNRIAQYGLESVKKYPKGPKGLKKGLGERKPFIEMPTTRVQEARESAQELAGFLKHPVRTARQAEARRATKPPTIKQPPKGIRPGPVVPEHPLGRDRIDSITKKIQAEEAEPKLTEPEARHLAAIAQEGRSEVGQADITKEAKIIEPEGPVAPAIGTLRADIAEREAELSDEQLSGITKRRRRRMIKESEAAIEASDIYQGELEGMDVTEREIDVGFYYVEPELRAEVEDVIGKPKRKGGFKTALQKMFTFERTEETRHAIGWDVAAAERGIEEIDISEFAQRVKDAYEGKKTAGRLNQVALERAETSGDPYTMMMIEKNRMLRRGSSDIEINQMITDIAEDNDIPIEEVTDQFVNADKMAAIAAMDEAAADTELERLAQEQIIAEEQIEAQQSAVEVLRANDIVAEVETVEEIPERKVDLLGRPLLEGGATGKQRGLGELGLEFTQPEAKDPDQMEFGDEKVIEQVVTKKKAGKVESKRVGQLRRMADTLDKHIENSRRPMTQNPTPKRNREYRSRLHDADNMERTQRAMRAMANALEKRELPKELEEVKTKQAIAMLVRKGLDPGGYYDVFPSQEYADTSSAGKALQQLIEEKESPEAETARIKREEKQAIQDAEEKVRFVKIQGFFPTPKPVIDTMLDKAEIEEGMSVLEPSAGKGDIADALKEAGHEAKVIEIVPSLQEILKLKKHDLVDTDFLEHTKKYDRIVMNPPFEKGQDVDHVKHAYDLLNPDGKLVSVMSEGTFFRQQKKYSEFRQWLDEVGGESEKLAQAFKGKEAFRQTGTTSRIVEIEKPAIAFEIRGRPTGAAISRGEKELILLAYGADSETGYHEGYHLIRGRLTASDIAILEKHFVDDEAEAAAFAEYAKTNKALSAIRRIFAKLKAILNKIKSGLAGKGFRTAEDIFGEIAEGKVKQAPAARERVRYETTGDRLRREAEHNARVKARKARLKAQTDLMPRKKKKVSRRRIKLKLQDHTPPLRADLAPLKPEAAEEVPLKTKTLTRPVYTDKWFEENLKRERRSVLDKFGSEARRSWIGLEKLFSPSSTRLHNIAPKLFRATRKYIYDVLTRSTSMIEEVDGFVKATRKMSRKDWRELDLAFKNGIEWKIDEIVGKYKLTEKYQKVREILNEIYDAAKEVGIIIEFRKAYWPRMLKDPEGFLLYVQGTEDWSIIEEAIKRRAEKAGRKIEDLTVDEKAYVVNTLLRGYRTQALTLSRPGPAKERTVESVDKKLDTFYEDSRTALLKYIKLMNTKIAEREFFGRETKEIQNLRKTQSARYTRLQKLKRRIGLKYPAEPKYKEHISKTGQKWKEGQERLERLKARPLSETIGGYVMALQAAGEISPTQEKEIQNLLTGIFDPKRMGSRMSMAASGIYIDLLNSPLQTMTQLDEFAYSFYRSPLRSIPVAIRTAARRSRVTPKAIGITSIGEEFKGPSMQKALSILLKSIGFEQVDRLNKENYINTVLSKYEAQSKRKNLNPTFVRRIKRVFGDEYKGVLEDLRNKRITDNVKYLLFNELLDIQPIAITEMPEAYNKAGNMRILYALKSFYIRRLDFIRNECFKDMKSKKTFARGFSKLLWLTFSFALMGAGSDFLKDFVRGKAFELKDSIADNLLRMIFFSKYQAWRTQEKGLGTAVLEGWRPPTKAIDALTRDIINEAKGKERGWELWRSVPVVGEEYYWWFGEGRRKIERTQEND